MARTFKLVKGDPASPTTSINIIDTAASGWILKQKGWSPGAFALDASEDHKIPEAYAIALKDTTHDNVASKIQTFIDLLRDAYLYHTTGWQDEPVFIQQQTTGETNVRYALVYGSPELEFPGYFDQPFESSSDLEFFALSIVREHPWGSLAPGQEGSAITLGASNGPASPDIVHVANFRDDGNLSHVFVDDGGVFGSNIISAGSGTALFPAVPVANDALYFGGAAPFKHIDLGIATAGNHVWVVELEYWDGADWNTVTTFGTDYTIFAENGGEVDSENSIFEQTGLWSINIFPPSDWDSTTVNSVSAFWIRLRLSTVTSTTTVPTKDASTIYAQRSNYVEIPAAQIDGDSPPLSITRIWTPSGGGSTVGPGNVSRILIAAKSERQGVLLASFEPMLNLGNIDNPAGWSTAFGTDTSQAIANEGPGGKAANCTFATAATLVKRVTLTGDNLLDDYTGEYRLFVGLQQTGGDAGDCEIKARIFVGGVTDTDPHVDTRKKKTKAVAKGIEVLDLGVVRYPLTRTYFEDSVASVDIGVEIHAERTTGTSTLKLYWAFLFPIDEGSVGIDDPVTDAAVGSSALRGGNVMDIDNGVIADRSLKQLYDGTNRIPAEEWARFNRPIEYQNLGKKTRLYFLMLHYATGNNWNTEPLIASLGVHAAVEIFMSYSFAGLRGSA